MIWDSSTSNGQIRFYPGANAYCVFVTATQKDLATEDKEHMCFDLELVSKDEDDEEYDLRMFHQYWKQEEILPTNKHMQIPIFKPTSRNRNLQISIPME